MSKYRLIAIDLDGSFLDDNHFKDDLTYFNKLIDINQEIVFCSGRATAGIIKLLEKIGIIKYCRYIIGHNGAEIYDLKENKIIYRKLIERDLAEEIIKIVLNNEPKNTAIAIHLWDKLYTNKVDEYVKLEGKVNFIDIVKIKNIEDYPKEIIKIMLFSETKENTDNIYNIMNNHFKDEISQARSVYFLNEITARDVNKFTGISYLINLLKIDKSEVIAFGNAENDLEMIKNVGLGFAMKNSEAILLSNSSNVTEYDNNNYGVEREIIKILDID